MEERRVHIVKVYVVSIKDIEEREPEDLVVEGLPYEELIFEAGM